VHKLIYAALAVTAVASATFAATNQDERSNVLRLHADEMSSADMPKLVRGISSRVSIDVDVKPAADKPGRFVVTSTILDLDTGEIVAKPRLIIGSDNPARIETGSEGKWMLQISVSANSTSRKAAYEAVFSREGVVVSKQRLALDLNS
jgi:hypothetical protein